MTTVAILPVPMEKGGVSYRGIAGDVRSQGGTVSPTTRGGDDAEENLALSCRACNAHKSMRVDGIDLDDETRATVIGLNMNSVVQRMARRQWMRLNLFP